MIEPIEETWEQSLARVHAENEATRETERKQQQAFFREQIETEMRSQSEPIPRGEIDSDQADYVSRMARSGSFDEAKEKWFPERGSLGNSRGNFL